MADLIDRQAVLKICRRYWHPTFNPIMEEVEKLPSAQPEPCEDTVSRQRLLSDLKELVAAWKKYPVMAKQIEGVETAIGYVEAIPPAQPVTDCISRQSAIDLINARLSQPCKNHTSEFVQGMEDGYCRIRSDIKCLPFAQPEIIRCKDCEYYKIYTLYGQTQGFCNRLGLQAMEIDDFCSRAERRSDETE